ncbi:1,4-alpha-glucan branching enzyme [Mariprofundus ferrinatatus]|uniref:1,4-alpha-glucan branching enzyme GlgB n=1 Tax=Mariprofundus ferrinatatus TaxID=1921087 RepID=A0A2K8LB94_9PROT|nr:1,4-alpha-glucan branching protein GlgB [Mariprofundus ferrinatatus]ATX82204.1 1,4-alpha-glucan branching enzyme [Mariprofundus ferrinatatus]
MNKPILSPEAWAIVEARSHDPFGWLGRHYHSEGGVVIRANKPRAEKMWILPEGDGAVAMQRIEGTDIFEYHWQEGDFDSVYRLKIENIEGHTWEEEDVYRFSPILGEMDLHLIGEGNHFEKYKIMGAHVREHEGVWGVGFSVWAPSADRVSVVGNFNHWDGREHQMRVRGSSGVWELFIPGLREGEVYKFELRAKNGDVFEKADPYAQQMELRPATASVVHYPNAYQWKDDAWVKKRAETQAFDKPMSIYEVHPGSWRRDGGDYINYRDMAHQLVEYCQWMGYTHIELLPITEHPFDGSWGYQTVGYFAPTSRFGTPDDFRYFIDYCHQNSIGVFLDWVPAHFPKDAFGLARFDGTPLYEHSDPRLGEHKDWGTYIFNFGRNEVRNFLIASALFWLDEFHIDGLRVDAVASMLYLDYSREEGEWVPNKYGGRENLEAVEFLKQFNHLVHERFPGAVTMAEESTSWPMVSRPTYLGGLGFTMKWNMGWMNDTLSYFENDPIYRTYHHHQLTFSMVYAFTENFILPFSHDEVVHGKGSMPGKMPGDDWQRFANLRLLYGYMYTHPGKKLQFMGLEFGQWPEWNFDTSLSWDQSNFMPHRGLQLMQRDMNHLYKNVPALHEVDFESGGFQWIDCNDAEHAILSYIRRDKNGGIVVVSLNLTPVPRYGYRLGVPKPGHYREVMNTDSELYGGANIGNAGGVDTDDYGFMDQPHSVTLTLPPLSCVILRPDEE